MSKFLRDYKPTGYVKDTYQKNHQNQTLDYVLYKKEHYKQPILGDINIWELIEKLDNIVDESDPDTSLPQSQHALQTAEAIEKKYPDKEWLQVTGLIHDLGKVLLLKNEPQWSVVGDTFPVGCDFSSDIIYHELFSDNPDNLKFGKLGIYQENCGLCNVHFSWGHDEFLAKTLEKNIELGRCLLPSDSIYIIRYHSFYAHHQSEAYNYLLDSKDKEMLPLLKEFQKFDLYTKTEQEVDIGSLKDKWKKKLKTFFVGDILV